MKLLTIIIPAYNVSDYIDECLGSLVEDPSLLQDLEVIAINDGSKDDTLIKMQRFAKEYPDTVTVIDKENGGHGSGINKGIELATGKYLKVLDSDDWVISSGLEELLQIIKNSGDDPDIIINPYEFIWQTDGHAELADYPNLKKGEIISLADLNRDQYDFTIHSLTIRTDIYQGHPIPKIDEKISYDDMEYILYPVPYINKVLYSGTVIYQYRFGMEGQSVSLQNFVKRRDQHKKVVMSLIRYYNENKELFTKEQETYYLNRLGFMISHHINILCSIEDNKTGKQELQQFIRECEGFDLKLVPNKKLKILLKTGCSGYSLIKWLFHFKQQ